MDKEEHGQNKRPPCIRTRNGEPNFELMAKAFINLHYATKEEREKNKQKEKDER